MLVAAIALLSAAPSEEPGVVMRLATERSREQLQNCISRFWMRGMHKVDVVAIDDRTEVLIDYPREFRPLDEPKKSFWRFEIEDEGHRRFLSAISNFTRSSSSIAKQLRRVAAVCAPDAVQARPE